MVGAEARHLVAAAQRVVDDGDDAHHALPLLVRRDDDVLDRVHLVRRAAQVARRVPCDVLLLVGGF